MKVVEGLATLGEPDRAAELYPLMLEAIAPRDHLAAAYRAALEGGYLWHEFGDVHLIL